ISLHSPWFSEPDFMVQSIRPAFAGDNCRGASFHFSLATVTIIITLAKTSHFPSFRISRPFLIYKEDADHGSNPTQSTKNGRRRDGNGRGEARVWSANQARRNCHVLLRKRSRSYSL